jgi:hypothetical protein
MTVLGGSHARLTTIITLEIVVAIEAFMVFLSTLKTFQFPFTLAFTMSDFLHRKHHTGFGRYGLHFTF